MKKKISITINEKILADIDAIIDNVYIRNRSQAIEHLVESSLGENKTAVILAGGPAEKLRVGKDYCVNAVFHGSRVIERAVKKMKTNGFRTIYVVAQEVVLTKAFEVLKDGSQHGVKVNYVEEKESRGTAASLKLLKGRISSNFLVVYGDIVFDNIKIDKLYNDHIKQKATSTIMLTTSNKPSTKGTVKVEGSSVLEFTQKPKQSDIYLVFSPIFVAEPEIMEYEGDSLEKDVFPMLASKGLLNGHLSSEKEVHVHGKEDLARKF